MVGNPALGPLGANGGPTATHALGPGSQAIDAATTACPTTDQRSYPRPGAQSPKCDVGAYEVQPNEVPRRPSYVEQLSPNDSSFVASCAFTDCTPGELSDRFDGVDSLAHLTVVAAPETDNVSWYLCPTGMPDSPTNANLASCPVVLGMDSTGVFPSPSSVAGRVDEAFDIWWDVPGAVDEIRRDVVALACIGPAQKLDAPNANCLASVEHNIFMDDESSGTAQNHTTTGEFGRYRTVPSCIGVAPGNATCDAAYQGFVNGSVVPNSGFDFRAFTSTDVASLQWVLNAPADASAEPGLANFKWMDDCSLIGPGPPQSKEWRCTVTSSVIPQSAGFVVSLRNANVGGAQPAGTGGYCNSNNAGSHQGAHNGCVLESFYLVSSP